MPDQADDLRQLVLEETGGPAHGTGDLPLVLVTGGKGGVGTTTVAVQLARHLADTRQQTLLVDADLHRADATSWWAADPRQTVIDLLAGRKNSGEIVIQLDQYLQLLPGSTPGEPINATPAARRRLAFGIEQFAETTNCCVVDAGNNTTMLARGLLPIASSVLLVTTPDNLAVMDTYAALKQILSSHQAPKTLPGICLLVNRVKDAEAAENVQRRFAETARRFVNVAVTPAGFLPEDAMLSLSSVSREIGQTCAENLNLLAQALTRQQQANKTMCDKFS